MGCFLACFGFKKKKKHRKPRNKCLSIEQNHVSYIPLDSDIPSKIEEKHHTSDSDLKKNAKEASRSKTKKKVSFNLNVKAYEPIRKDENDLSEGEEEEKIDTQTSKSSYPPNHRYRNCMDSFDEEEDEFNDLDFDKIEDSDDEEEGSYGNESDEEISNQEEDFPWEMNFLDTNEVIVADNQITEGKNISDGGVKSNSCNARDRSKYVSSVLNPVENITQWKAVKAKETPVKRQKENNDITLDQRIKCNSEIYVFQKTRNSGNISRSSDDGIAVDASLSNWLGFSSSQTKA